MRYLINKKGQGLLEATITIVLMVLLLGGIINIWIWSNKQLVIRQRNYNATRVIAGTAGDNYELRWAPSHPVYIPESLAENKVLLDAPLLAYEEEVEDEESPGAGGGGETPAAAGPGTRSTPFAPPLETDNIQEENDSNPEEYWPENVPKGVPEEYKDKVPPDSETDNIQEGNDSNPEGYWPADEPWPENVPKPEEYLSTQGE